MKNNCDCCSREFKMLTIRCIVPSVLDDKVVEFHLCRPCFLASDNMSFTEFMEFMERGGQTEKQKDEDE